MSTTPLTDAITALTTYSNTVTGASDTTLSDAVGTLVAGYGGGGGNPEDYAKGLEPSGDIVLTGNNPLISYGIAGRSRITSITIPTATRLSNGTAGYLIVDNGGSFTVYAPLVTSLTAYAIANNSGLTAVSLPSINGSLASNNLRANSNLEIADIGEATNFTSNCFYGGSKLKKLILRKADAICTLGNTSALAGTPFASGGSGGTVYVPSALISSYQVATNWSTLYNAGTCTFVALEGSPYESTSWIEGD